MARRHATATANAPPARDAPVAAPNEVEEVLRAAALALFAERGFHGTSMREIAARAGTSVSHMYYYFPSKSQVLKSLVVRIVEDLLGDLATALERVGPTPTARLDALVRAEVLFHCRRQPEAFVGRSELRSLSPEDRPEVIALFDRVTSIFHGTIRDGIADGSFRCEYPAEATSAILTMCNAVSSWYRRKGRLSPQAIALRYSQLSLRMVGGEPGR